MGYVDKVLADNEAVVYRTRQHGVVLLRDAGAMLFVFVVFLAIGLLILLPRLDEAGNEIRFVVGVITLGSVLLPAFVIIRTLQRGARGRKLIERVWRSITILLVGLVAAIMLMFTPDFRPIGWLAIAISVLPLLEIIRVVAEWRAEQYIITTHRVVQVEGITDKHIRDSALEKVNDVELDQSFLGRIFRFGSVEIITGSDIGVNQFHLIKHPVRFKRAMLNAKEKLGSREHAQETEPTDAEPTAPERSIVPDLIADLARLYEAGILSEEEYQTKKKDLLARL
ncbi:MAG: PH domain-containing protein [Anaerolineae bacterium]|jgi:hypothetical protein